MKAELVGHLPRFDPRVGGCLEAVLVAADKINSLTTTGAALKGDQFVGHHAIVTPADILAQETVLNLLGTRFPNAHLISEEKSSDPLLKGKLLTWKNYLRNIQQGEVFCIDPLDGTSQHNRGLYEWSISIGVMEDMQHLGGAIYAPDIKKGTLVVGDMVNGVYLIENGNLLQKVELKGERKFQDAMIYTAVDMRLDSGFNVFGNYIARNARTTKDTGSAAVGLACVAAGKVDVFLLHPVRVWDWFGGYPLVEIAGGKIHFYRLRDGKIEVIDKLQPTDYHPNKKEIGLIAGNPSLVNRLTEELIKQYHK